MESPVHSHKTLSKTTFARFVSIVGHPFTFIVLLLPVPSWSGDSMSALRVTGIVVAVALVPLGLFCRQCFISGRWSTVDASDRGERPGLLLAGLIVLLPLSLYFLFVEQSSALVQGSAAIGSMLAVGAALNRWIKLSGHLAMAGFTGLIGRIHLGYGLAVAVFIPLLAWSRLALLRHTLSRSSAVWPAV